MREVSCRPVRSEDDTLTGAPRCRRMLTFRSRSMPDTCRGDVFAADHRRKITINSINIFYVVSKSCIFPSFSKQTGLATVWVCVMCCQHKWIEYDYYYTIKQVLSLFINHLITFRCVVACISYQRRLNMLQYLYQDPVLTDAGLLRQPEVNWPVCEVGVSGVGGAPSWVPRGRPDAAGIPLAPGFLLCLNLSSRTRRSLSASSAARLAPYE